MIVLAAVSAGELAGRGRRRRARARARRGSSSRRPSTSGPRWCCCVAERTLRVCALYPDLLQHLRRPRQPAAARAPLRSGAASASSSPAPGSARALDPDAHDLFYIGGGQDRDQALCALDMVETKRDALHAAAGRGAVVFAVCGGYQLLGHGYAMDDERLPGVGLVDLETVREDGPRLIGNVAIELDDGHGARRASRTTAAGRGSGRARRPLGRVLRGHGNDGRSGFEGVRGGPHGTVVGTYLHGPLLPKNAHFADWLTATALGWAVRAPRSSGAASTTRSEVAGPTPSQGPLTAARRGVRRPDQAASLEFREATKRYPGHRPPRRRRPQPRGPRGRDLRAGRPVGLRQDHRDADGQPDDRDHRAATSSSAARSVRERDEDELRRDIGYVIQQIGLFPHRTVADNIATVPKLLGWDKRRTAARVDELLDLIGLERELGRRYPAQLSGGQRQRVGVARALAADPPVMLMDEPFGAIDPINRERLQNEFLRLQAEIRKTIVFVTHDIDEAIKMGDRIAILQEGGILAQYAPPAELLMHPANHVRRGLRRRATARSSGLSLQRVRDVELLPAHRRSPTGPSRVLALDDAAARRAQRDARRRGRARPGRRRRRARRRRAVDRAAVAATGCARRDRALRPDSSIHDRGAAAALASRTTASARAGSPTTSTATSTPLWQHVYLTLVSVAIGFAIAFAPRAARAPPPLARAPITQITGDPLHAAERGAVLPAAAAHRPRRHDRDHRARRLHAADPVPQHHGRARERARRRRATPAAGWASPQRQLLWRVELPLALPEIMAGLRIAVTTTVGLDLAGVPGRRRRPRRGAVRRHHFRSNVLVAGGLAVAAGGRARPARSSACRRLITPWTRAGGMTTLAFLGDFGDAFDYIFHSRESQAGGAQVGGTELWPLIWTHLEITGAGDGDRDRRRAAARARGSATPAAARS